MLHLFSSRSGSVCIRAILRLFRLGARVQKMRGGGLVLSLLASVPAMSGQQSIPLVAGTWAVSGSQTFRDGIAGAPFDLPAGGELFRAVDTDRLSLRILSQPFFGAEPANWPSIEIGAASLTFVKEPGGGTLVLFGDRPLRPAATIPLGADGRSRTPLDLTLSFDRTRRMGSLLLDGAVYSVDTAEKPGPIDIVVSAGDGAAWPIATMELQRGAIAGTGRVELPETEEIDPSRSSKGKEKVQAPKTADELRNEMRQSGIDRARALFAKGSAESAESVLGENSRNLKDTPRWHLEVANELVHLAFSFARAGEVDAAVQISRRALRHLELIGRKSDEPALVAAAEEIAAMIHERLLGDRAGAKKHYRAASQRYAEGGAAKALQRMERMEAEASLRSSRHGKEGGQ